MLLIDLLDVQFFFILTYFILEHILKVFALY